MLDLRALFCITQKDAQPSLVSLKGFVAFFLVSICPHSCVIR